MMHDFDKGPLTEPTWIVDGKTSTLASPAPCPHCHGKGYQPRPPPDGYVTWGNGAVGHGATPEESRAEWERRKQASCPHTEWYTMNPPKCVACGKVGT